MEGRSNLLVQTIRAVTVVNFGDATILDSLHIERIGQELYELVDRFDRRQIVLDFSGVRFLSSQALAVLLTLRRKLEAVKGRVVICGLRSDLREIFRITKLEKIFEFQPDEERALNVFGVSGLA
jgi:anti-sigma B factor antagonist